MLHPSDVSLILPSEVKRDCRGAMICVCLSEGVFSTTCDDKGLAQPEKRISWRRILDIALQEDFELVLQKDSFQFPGNLGALLDHFADLYPNRNGIVVPGEVLSFQEYRDRVCRMVHGLQKIGLQRNDRLLLISPNTLNYALIALAVLRLGAVLVPANPRIGHYELAHFLSETGPTVVMCESGAIPSLYKAYDYIQEASTPHVITLDEKAPSTTFVGELDLSVPSSTWEVMEPNDNAMIVYTGSADGYGLGAELTHACLFYDAVSFAGEAFKDDDSKYEVVTCILPLFHTYGFTTGLLTPLAGGVTCLLLNTSLGARMMVSFMEAYQATQIFSVPAIYFSIMKPLSDKPELCSRFNNLTSGGIAIPMKLLQGYQKQLGLNISEGYGLTETSPVATWSRANRPPKFGTVGYPLACCQVKVADDSGKDVPLGQEGEVLVRGLNLFSGYLNQPEHTRNAFLGDWFKTGDVGHIDHENYLTITGLKKDMINILGLKVYPKEVERILGYHPAIREARIWGEWDEKFGYIVAGELFLEPGHAMSTKDLQIWCRGNLSPYKIPRKIQINP
jgi:long-chain acyl-CoA synthetase